MEADPAAVTVGHILRFLPTVLAHHLARRIPEEVAPGLDRAAAQRVFAIMDADNSGSVSVDELMRASAMLGLKFSRARLEQMVRAVDRDNSGQVEFEEYLTLLNAAEARADRRAHTAKSPAASPMLGSLMQKAVKSLHADESQTRQRLCAAFAIVEFSGALPIPRIGSPLTQRVFCQHSEPCGQVREAANLYVRKYGYYAIAAIAGCLGVVLLHPIRRAAL